MFNAGPLHVLIQILSICVALCGRLPLKGTSDGACTPIPWEEEAIDPAWLQIYSMMELRLQSWCIDTVMHAYQLDIVEVT